MVETLEELFCYRKIYFMIGFLWFTINKRYTKATKDIYVCGLYIPPSSSKYFDPGLFEELEKDVLNFSSQGSILEDRKIFR